MDTPEIFKIAGRFFFFKPAPHFTIDMDCWHNAYIDIIDRFLNAPSSSARPTELPAYPLRFDKPEGHMDLVFEMGSYWEGAMYFLCHIIGARTPLEGIRQVENSHRRGCETSFEKIFVAIWNSHGQLKWLKAFLIRFNMRVLSDKEDYTILNGEDDTVSSEKLHEAGVKYRDKELLWLSSFVSQHKDEGKKYPNPYFGGGNPLHLGLILSGIKAR